MSPSRLHEWASCALTRLYPGRYFPRRLPFIVIGFLLGVGGMTFAHRHEEGESVRVIATQDIKEALDGKEEKVTVVEVTIEPGQAGLRTGTQDLGSSTYQKANTNSGSMIGRPRCSKQARPSMSRRGVCTEYRRTLLQRARRV